jgi:mannosyltransferase
MYVDRYVLYVLPAWLLLAAAGLTSGSRAVGWRVAAGVLIFLAVGLPAQLEIRRPDGHGQASRAAASMIATELRPGDAVIYALPETGGSWFARDAVARYVRADSAPRDALAVRPQRTGGHVVAGECADPAPCLADAPRVWVLRNSYVADPLAGLSEPKRAVLLERYETPSVRHLTGITLALLVRRQP